MKHTIKTLIKLVTVANLLFSCESEVQFTETIIDNDGPQDLWMKTLGDINGDGKTDLLVGGWTKGGLVAYLAPDWKKQIINDTLKISTDAEVGDLDNNGS